MYSLMVRKSYTLHSIPLHISSIPIGTLNSHLSIIDCIPFPWVTSPIL